VGKRRSCFAGDSCRLDNDVEIATTLERTGSTGRTKHASIDCDVHPELDFEKDLYPYLSTRWREHVKPYGIRTYSGATYPRFQNRREDAFPPNGRGAGTDCAFMSKQLLDECGIAFAILPPPSRAVPVLNSSGCSRPPFPPNASDRPHAAIL